MSDLAIRNWARYQHYSNRPGLPWVKFHVDLLDDEEFRELDDSTRLVGCLLLLVARRRGNRFPASPHWLAAEVHVSHGKAKVALAKLLALRFLVPASECASAVASSAASATSSGHASPPARPRADEMETEIEKKESPNGLLSETADAESDDPLDEAAIQTVYRHWLNVTGRTHGRYKTITPARRLKIRTRLREFSVTDLITALNAVAADDWPERGKFTELTTLFRSREKVEEWLEKSTGVNGHGSRDQERKAHDERIAQMQRERGWVE